MNKLTDYELQNISGGCSIFLRTIYSFLKSINFKFGRMI